MRLHRALVVVLFAVAVPALADSPREEAATKALTGASGKLWVHVAMRIFLGGEKKCKQGETWLFRPDGRVQIDRCVAGKIETSTASWSVRPLDALDLTLIVGDRDYVLILPPPAAGKKTATMVLRRRTNSKAEPTQDLDFTYEQE